jgi:uncharacterized alpha-E superfamily protein
MNYQQLLESLMRQLEQLTESRAGALRELHSLSRLREGDPGFGAQDSRRQVVASKLKRLHTQLAEVGGALSAVARAADSQGANPHECRS